MTDRPRIDDDAGYRPLGGGTPLQVCDRCGAAVMDVGQHDLWHHANLAGGDITIRREDRRAP